MTNAQSPNEIIAAALRLPPKKRASVAEKILESMDDPETLSAAAKIADERWRAYERGEMEAKPAEQVIARLLGRKARKKAK